MNKTTKNFVFGILIILFSLNILTWVAVYDLSQPRFLEVIFFDVGQGDAIFIETPENHQILIDGGPDSTILEKLGKEMPFWDRTIDLIILTHPEHDHMSGLLEVLKRYRVEKILWTGVLRDTAEYQEWLKLIKEEGAVIEIAKAGQRIVFSKPGLTKLDFFKKPSFNRLNRLDILYPFENLEGKEFKNTNNTSIVARLVFGNNSFLFTGDAYKSVERKILGEEVDSDILKIGHHGSKTSTAQEFVAAVFPDIAVISVGRDNRYGHPHPQTLEVLRGVRVLRTDLDGDIKIISDGVQYKVK